MKSFVGKWLYGLWAVLGVTYLLISIRAPYTSNVYNINRHEQTILIIITIVPILLIWYAAIYGASKFKHYAKSIIGRPDGQSLNHLANGLIVVALGLIANGLINRYEPYMLVHGDSYRAYIIATNYLQLAILLVCIYYIWRGSSQIVKQVKGQVLTIRGLKITLLPLAVYSAVYAWLLHGDVYRNNVSQLGQQNSYFLADWQILLTIVLPYILILVLGGLAALNIRVYTEKVKGIIYKQAFGSLSIGIVMVIIVSILLQLIGTINLTVLSHNVILLLIFVLIILYSSGYVIIAVGARKLNQIEEVQ